MTLTKNCPTCGSDDPKRWDHANSIDPGGCANPWHEGWHVITERADGPDFDDLVRLIRYLREHDLQHRFTGEGRAGQSGMTVDWFGPESKSVVSEDFTHSAMPYFVGPDGTAYDANMEAQ